MAKNAKFIVRYKVPIIDRAKWDKRLADRLTKVVKKGAVVWLNATVLLAVPVWSGASRATFLKLARSVGFPLTITGIRAKSSDNKRALGPSVGFQKSEGKLNVDQVKQGIVSFTYGTSLFHLVFNEFQNANQNPKAGRLFARLSQPGPYNFQKIGKAAFEDYVQDAFELPSPWRSLKFRRIRVG